MLEYVVGAGVGGAFCMWLYKGISGCTNGHVWGDWEATRRWRTLSWGNKPEIVVEREYKRQCQVDGCTAEDSEYQTVSDDVRIEDFKETLTHLEGYDE
jgi:hypothetical protein